MSKDGDMSLFNDVLQPFRRIINTDPPKDKLSSKLNISDSNQSIKEVEVGARGIPAKSLHRLLKDLGLPRSAIGTFIDRVSKMALTGSYSIWLSREGSELSAVSSDFLTPRLKRKLSNTSNETPEKRTRIDSESSAMSPWESSKIKGDLIVTKAEVTKLQLLLDKQNNIRKEMQILFDSEREVLNEQHQNDVKALASMEEHVKDIRRREKDAKAELEEAKKQIRENKLKWDNENSELHSQVSDLKTSLQELTSSSQGQLTEMKRDMDELMAALEGAQAEAEILKKELEKQTAKAEQCITMKAQLDKQTVRIQELNNKVQTLEHEKSVSSIWQQHSKLSEKRLSTLIDLEKEVVKLREKEKFLRDMVRNKLLLEEQVHSMSSRLEALKPIQQELHEAKMKVVDLERSLEEWMSVARNRGASCARSFVAILDQELHKEVTAVSDCAHAQSKLAQVIEEMATAKYEREKANTMLTELQKSFKIQENMIRKLQKRVILVTRERDCYREQLDCYEKDLTVTSDVAAAGGNTPRVQQLEKTIQGYRDLLAKYDSEENSKVVESLQSELNKWRDEAESLRRDCTALRAQRDNLQAHLQRLTSNTKVLHLTENPAAMAQKEVQNELQNAQEEIKKLKEAIREGSQACPDEVAQLKQQVERNKIKAQRMKEEFVSSALEYRDVCYMLLGYKVDRTGPKNYRLSSMYTESPNDEFLMFTLRDGDIELVQTDYSDSLEELVDVNLRQHGSIPLFLSSLTIDLFTKSTVMEEEDSDE